VIPLISLIGWHRAIVFYSLDHLLVYRILHVIFRLMVMSLGFSLGVGEVLSVFHTYIHTGLGLFGLATKLSW